MTHHKNGLTQKQDTFCLKYFELGNATEAAILAGYSPKTADVIASENLTKPKILARIEDLRSKAEDTSVASVQERMQRLTNIIRANVIDFIDKEGEPELSEDNPNHGAASEFKHKVIYTKAGSQVTTKEIKLHSPLQAMDILNKMDGAYAPEKHALIIKHIAGDMTDDELLSIAAQGGAHASRGGNGATEKTPSTK